MTAEEELREAGRRIASGYDFWAWDQDASHSIDPASLQPVALRYGAGGSPDDILDLGCGMGALLERAGSVAGGRLVGTDISEKACATSRERLAALCNRVQIIHADFLDLDAAQLGQFDIIFCIGVIYILPKEVRDHVLRLIASCLRPGGIAVMTYYNGLAAAVRAHIARSLRALTGSDGDPQARTEDARQNIDELREATNRPSQYSLGLRSAFRHMDLTPDPYFYAELINEAFEAMSTVELERTMAPSGIEFATYLGHSGFEPWYSSRDRAILADRLDLVAGQYPSAMFVRPAGKPQAAPPGARLRPLPTELPVPSLPRPRGLKPVLRGWARKLFWKLFRI